MATHISRGDTLVLMVDRHDVELGQRTQATVKQLRQQWQLLVLHLLLLRLFYLLHCWLLHDLLHCWLLMSRRWLLLQLWLLLDCVRPHLHSL